MNFNFNETAGISQSSTRKTLEGNKIHEVKFDGCEARDIQGVQDPSKVYHVLDIKFSNDEGYFTHTIWEPRDSDMEDTQGSFGPTPSNVKSMMLTLKHLIDAVNPELGKQIDKKEKSLNASSWETLRQAMVKATEPGKGTITKIKLVKRKNGEASFPGFVASYNRQGQLYMRTNFIGNNIFFTNKELEAIKKQEAAKPTNMSDALVLDETPKVEEPKNEDFNFDIAAL